MPKHNSINGIHAQRLKDIRPFVNFDFDLRRPLSKSQKAKIRKYYNEIQALTARPYQVYRPRRKDHLRKAQAFGQHEKRLPGLKVAFIPNDGREKLRIRFDSQGEIVAKSRYVTTRRIDIDPLQLIDDPEAYIESLVAERPENSYTVLSGEYEIPVGLSKAVLPAYVARLTAKYDNPDANNYFGNWLHGLAAHEFENQDDFLDYLSAKEKAKNAGKLKRRAKKKKEQRERLKR